MSDRVTNLGHNHKLCLSFVCFSLLSFDGSSHYGNQSNWDQNCHREHEPTQVCCESWCHQDWNGKYQYKLLLANKQANTHTVWHTGWMFGIKTVQRLMKWSRIEETIQALIEIINNYDCWIIHDKIRRVIQLLKESERSLNQVQTVSTWNNTHQSFLQTIQICETLPPFSIQKVSPQLLFFSYPVTCCSDFSK